MRTFEVYTNVHTGAPATDLDFRIAEEDGTYTDIAEPSFQIVNTGDFYQLFLGDRITHLNYYDALKLLAVLLIDTRLAKDSIRITQSEEIISI
jgi:hypothetical protein